MAILSPANNKIWSWSLDCRWLSVFLFFLAVGDSSAQYRNYSLRCLAPLLESVDPNAPETIQQAFLLGPTRIAKPIEGIGRGAIQFPISTESDAAQKFFEQGIALLHTFSYKDAEIAFRTVVELDPDCPMGYWGLAQAHERRPAFAQVFAKAAKDRCDRNRPALEQRWTLLLSDFYENLEATDLATRSANRVQALE